MSNLVLSSKPTRKPHLEWAQLCPAPFCPVARSADSCPAVALDSGLCLCPLLSVGALCLHTPDTASRKSPARLSVVHTSAVHRLEIAAMPLFCGMVDRRSGLALCTGWMELRPESYHFDHTPPRKTTAGLLSPRVLINNYLCPQNLHISISS